MVEISFSSSFKRAYKRRIAGNPERELRFQSKLKSFQNDPFDTSLRTHKLSGKLREYWSFSVEYDLRIIFFFADDEKVVLPTSEPTEKFTDLRNFLTVQFHAVGATIAFIPQLAPSDLFRGPFGWPQF